MNHLLLLPLFGLIVTIMFMLILRPVAIRLGLVDHPGGRKIHSSDTPLTGGLAMAAGVAVITLLSRNAIEDPLSFVLALAILVTVGVVDDRYDIPYQARLLAQLCAALLMVFGADVLVADLGNILFGKTLPLGPLSVPFTLVLVLTATNAFNLFDGSDGVAGGQALIGLVAFAVACGIAGATQFLPIILGLAGCVSGFLVFNWPLKRTSGLRAFMGDAGSTLLGFSLAWVSVQLTQGESRVVRPSVALWIFALPLFDLFSSVLRRIQNGRSPFEADGDHLHHVLRRFGWSSQKVAVVILSVSALLSTLAIAAHFLHAPGGSVFGSWLVVGCIYHVIFGSGYVIKRRREPRFDLQDQARETLWDQGDAVVMKSHEQIATLLGEELPIASTGGRAKSAASHRSGSVVRIDSKKSGAAEESKASSAAHHSTAA